MSRAFAARITEAQERERLVEAIRLAKQNWSSPAWWPSALLAAAEAHLATLQPPEPPPAPKTRVRFYCYGYEGACLTPSREAIADTRDAAGKIAAGWLRDGVGRVDVNELTVVDERPAAISVIATLPGHVTCRNSAASIDEAVESARRALHAGYLHASIVVGPK
jgi:hypothetical protein